MRYYKNIYYQINLIFTFLIVGVVTTTAQNYPVHPWVSNYLDFKNISSGQNWSVTQDEEGIMYFANTSGLLEFNGKQWRLHPLTGYRRLRTVAYDPESKRLYSGTFEDFGYWERNKEGELIYNSLKSLINKEILHNDEIWSIFFWNNHVYFRTFVNYLDYDGTSVSIVKLPTTCQALTEVNNRLYAASTSGLYELFNGIPQLVPGGNQFTNDKQIFAMLPFNNDRLLLATMSNGLFLYDGQSFTAWHTESDNLLKEAQINRAIMMSDSVYVFGTLLNGVVAINRYGKQLWHLNKSNGLQNSTVLGLYADKEHNLWLALDNGIDRIEVNSNFRFYEGYQDNIEAVYAIAAYQNTLYLGTNKGLFYCPSGQQHFELIPNTRGQVWDLSEWDGQLLCGHNAGTFRIEKNKAYQISSITGGYTLRELPNSENKRKLLQSTYTALTVFLQDAAGKWQRSYVIENFIEPIRYLEIDHQLNIWAGHLEQGLFKIRLNQAQNKTEEIKYYDSIGDHSAEHIGVFKINNAVVFTTGHRLYTYDDIHDTIIAYQKLNDAVGDFKDAYRIVHAEGQKYWFFRKGAMGLIELHTDGTGKLLQEITYAMLGNKVLSRHECIYSTDNNIFYIGLSEGFVEINKEYKHHPSTGGDIVLSNISAFGNNKKEAIALNPYTSSPVLPATYNNIHFSFAFASYALSNNKVWYKLEGLDMDWILATNTYEQEYSRLPSGVYTFIIKVTNPEGENITSFQYPFTIQPAWHNTTIARLLFLGLVILLVITSNRVWRKRMLHQQQRTYQLREQKRLEELEQKEQKITKLKNEKLAAELLFKSKELASSSMSVIQKDNVLLELKKELQKEDSCKHISNIIKIINKNLSTEENWKVFQANFDIVHDHFFRNIKIRYPKLTPHELQLCAYLRLNLSTKEIAQLTGNSVRGVEVARYRLRKKLGLAPEENLNEFMMDFKY